MPIVYFLYGLAFFCLGVVVSLEARRSTNLVLGRHLPWLAAFGFLHGCLEWTDLALLMKIFSSWEQQLILIRTLLLPIAALFLVRFGAGLVAEAGPLPRWMAMLPVAILVPLSLTLAYAITLATTSSDWALEADIWSRYLLYFTGCVLAAVGLLRQRRGLHAGGLKTGGDPLLIAAFAFLLNAFVAGLIVPHSSTGLASWLNEERFLGMTKIPIQIWRALSAMAVALSVVRALDVFEAEREAQMKKLRLEREQSQTLARNRAERWRNSVVSISRMIAHLQPMEQILENVIALATDLLECDAAAFGLWDEAKSGILIKSSAPKADGPAREIHLREGLLWEAARSETPLLLAPQASWSYPILDEKATHAALVPLRLNDEPLGALWAIRTNGRPFNQDDLDGLEILADQAMIALEHTMMAARLQSVAVIEERSRIAREMHDSLAQLLGYLSLELQTLRALVLQENHRQALKEIQIAHERIREAQDDVRENIISLRTTLSAHGGFLPALREYLEEFGLHTGIEVELICDETDSLPLSSLAETQMVCIVQEALSNVRKHAMAKHVQIRIASRQGYLAMSITDDGIGFQSRAQRGHFGLQTMHERAEQVGGAVTVNSIPGNGTQVELWLPVIAA